MLEGVSGGGWGVCLCDVYVNKVNVFLTFRVAPAIRVCVVTRCMRVPGEDVRRRGADAAGKQAGPCGQSKTSSDSGAGAETSSGEGAFEYSKPLSAVIYSQFYFDVPVCAATPGSVLRVQRQKRL